MDTSPAVPAVLDRHVHVAIDVHVAVHVEITVHVPVRVHVPVGAGVGVPINIAVGIDIAITAFAATTGPFRGRAGTAVRAALPLGVAHRGLSGFAAACPVHALDALARTNGPRVSRHECAQSHCRAADHGANHPCSRYLHGLHSNAPGRCRDPVSIRFPPVRRTQ